MYHGLTELGQLRAMDSLIWSSTYHESYLSTYHGLTDMCLSTYHGLTDIWSSMCTMYSLRFGRARTMDSLRFGTHGDLVE